MKTIDLVYFNAGGGHRSAAKALETQALARVGQTSPMIGKLLDTFA